MYNVKVFPSFTAPKNASTEDMQFLGELQQLKAESHCLYANFSVFDYGSEQTGSVHFVTYPIDWITHYIQSQYAEIDPLLKMDHRRVAHTDWGDLQIGNPVQEMFASFRERGLGEQGLTLANPISGDVYGTLSLCFDIPEDRWGEFKRETMSVFRYQIDRLCGRYSDIYLRRASKHYNLSPREIDCLFWIALGKTDEQVAEILNIGKWTVVSHVKSAKFKLDCPNRTSAASRAVAEGIISIPKTG